jgi:hypothetical protein
MSKLSLNERVQILSLLCEGASMRSISRVTGASINTIAKLLKEAGEACIDFHDEHVRGLNCKRIECDEIWSFVYAKEKNVPENAPLFAGDVWTWTSIWRTASSFAIGSSAGAMRTLPSCSWTT